MSLLSSALPHRENPLPKYISYTRHVPLVNNVFIIGQDSTMGTSSDVRVENVISAVAQIGWCGGRFLIATSAYIFAAFPIHGQPNTPAVSHLPISYEAAAMEHRFSG